MRTLSPFGGNSRDDDVRGAMEDRLVKYQVFYYFLRRVRSSRNAEDSRHDLGRHLCYVAGPRRFSVLHLVAEASDIASELSESSSSSCISTPFAFRIARLRGEGSRRRDVGTESQIEDFCHPLLNDSSGVIDIFRERRMCKPVIRISACPLSI